MKSYLQWLVAIMVIVILGACNVGDINTNNTTKGDTNTTGTTPLCEVPYKDITYGCVTSQTGRIWLDRNIGAARVAASSPNQESHGYYFQWGRPADGHQFAHSEPTSERATTIFPSSNEFIIVDNTTTDWVEDGADTDGIQRRLFLSVVDGKGICPQGYRVPTAAEWKSELKYAPNMRQSVLKLPLAGFRNGENGEIEKAESTINGFMQDVAGYYLASDNSSQKQAKFLFLAQDGKGRIETKGRAYGYSVRCIKAHTNERGKVSDVNIAVSERSGTGTGTGTEADTGADTGTGTEAGTGTGTGTEADTGTETETDGTSEGLSSNGGGGTATIDPNRSPVRNKLIMEYIPDNNNVEYNTVTKRIRKIKNTADWDRNHVYDLLQTTGRSQPRLRRENGNNYIFFNNDSKLVNAEVWVNDQANGTKKGFTENGTDMTIYVVANTLEMGNHTLLAWNKGEWKRDSINGRTNVTREYTTNIRMSLDLPRDTGRAVAFFGKFSDGESSTTLKSNILNNSEIFNQKFCWKFETHGTTRNLYKNFIKVASKTNAYSNLSRVNWGQFILGSNGRASKAKAYVYAVLVYRGRVSALDDEKIKNWIKSKFRISYIPVSINESTRVISDTNTHLQWQDNSDTGTVTKSWAGANTYCANLVFNGHDDWRLPTILELESVMSNAKKNRVFRYIITGRKYWATLATYVPTDHAWAIRKNGRRAWVTKTTPLYIRCVRGGTSGEISSDNNSNEGGTVTPVNPTSTTRGRFNAAEDTDYFKIVIPYTGTLLVETTGSTDTSGSLLDASGVQVASDNNSGTGANFKFLKRVTAGTYYVRVKRNSASSTGHYALVTHFNDHGGKITLATPINPNSATAGRIEKAGDVDWFRVTIPRGGGILTVKTTGTTDTVGTLYNASGTKITENDNGDLHSNFRISRTVAAGKYYVRVKHRSASSTGRYTLVSQFSDHGNSKTTATSINLNSTTAGNIEVAESADYFKIVIPRGGGRLTVNTTGSTNTRGALLDANGTQVASDDNSGPDHNFRISKSVPAGTYYMKVSASSTGHYELVSQFDDHGSGKRTATSINPNSTTPGSLEVVGDNDWFKIVVTNEGILAVETNSSLDIDITLYNASGYQIAFDDNSGSGNNAKIEKKVSSGTYYAKVNHHHSSKTGNYSFVVRLTPEDHGDTKAKATSIDLNSTTSGSLEIVGDNDWFKIVVTNSGALVVETTGSLDTDITLYNAGGTQVAFDDNSGSGNNAKIAKKVSSGTYYVKVNHHDSSETGNYLLVSQFIADDHGSTKETATLIAQTKVLTLAESRRYEPFERTVPGSIDFAGDEDWFKIVTTDIGNLTVETTGSTDTGITLYDENNNEVPLDGNSTTRISGGTYSSTKGWPHTYYVRVKHRNPSGTGDYSLVVKIVSDVGGYNYATAEKIQPNSTIHAALNFDDDQDYFEINITSAGTLTVGTLTVSPKTNKDATDTYGFLYRKEDLTSLTSVDRLSSEGDTVNWIGANNNIYNDGSNRNFRIIKQVTPGIYYVRVRGYYNEFSGPDTNHLQTGEYKFYSQFVADDHGSTKETATFIDKTTEELSGEVTVPGRIGFAGDEDWFKIVTTDIGNLTVKTTGSTDTVVTLYDQNDNEVPLDNNFTTRISGGTSSSTEGSHTYYVRVKHRNSSGTGDYSLVVKLAFDVGGDIYARATTIQPNSTIQAALNFVNDQDYFKIVLPYAGTLTVGTTGTTDTYGHLYNKKDLVSLTYEDYSDWNTTWLTSNNNIYNDASDDNFRIIKYLTAGTYYVRVRSYYQPYGADKDHLKTGEYTLYSQFSDHGNSRSTATSINPNSTTEGRFERAGDEDFFKIVISHSATLTLKTTGSTDTVGTLLDASGNEIAQNDNANGSLGSNFRISRSVTAGTYYVKVKHRNRAATGEYTLVSSLDDDHGNSRSTATPISPNSITPGRIERAGDVDFFKIEMSHAERLTIKTTGSTDTVGTLYNASGTQIVSDDNGDSGSNFIITRNLTAGTYYVKVSASSIGSYSLISQFVQDDHGSTKETATSITPDSTTAGRIDFAGDVDWFKIVFPEKGRLDVKTTGSGDTIGELLDANGNKLVSSSGADHNFIITRNVMAGTYYVKVKHHSSTAISNYSLVSKFRPGVSTE